MRTKKKAISISEHVAVIRCPNDVDVVVIDPTAQGESSLPEVCYQPEYDKAEWERLNFADFLVYRDREKAQMDFPRLKILKYRLNEIHQPVIVD
jgi:hypothetical protein